MTGHLQLPALRLVVDKMVGAGEAEYDPPAGARAKGVPPAGFWVYWKRPDEWAAVIYDWVRLLFPRANFGVGKGGADRVWGWGWAGHGTDQGERVDEQHHDVL